MEEMINRRLLEKGGGKKRKRAAEKKTDAGDDDQCAAQRNVSKDYLIGVDEEFVVELNERNFDSLVMASGEMWMVDFFAHWCNHC
jgi:hypothetical protein